MLYVALGGSTWTLPPRFAHSSAPWSAAPSQARRAILGCLQPAVTKQLKNLEAHVGARLLERSTKIVRPTPLGQSLYKSSRSALATIDFGGRRRETGHGHCAGVAARSRAVMHWSETHPPIVPAFQEQHSGVTVDSFLEDRALTSLRQLRRRVKVRQARRTGSDRAACRPCPPHLVASPAFLNRHGEVRKLRRLAEIPLVTRPPYSHHATL